VTLVPPPDASKGVVGVRRTIRHRRSHAGAPPGGAACEDARRIGAAGVPGERGATVGDTDGLVEFARSYTEAWCSQDPARVAAHFAPGGSLTIKGGAPAVGREAITDAARSFMTALPDLRVMMDELVAGDDGVRYHWTLEGTNTGPGGTGRRVRVSGFERWTLAADGLIGDSLGGFDQADYDRQIAGADGP